MRKTQVRDFRGGTLTYDSHNGTDFATAPGTVIVAPAAARVVLVVSEFHRGGLKLLLDHGAHAQQAARGKHQQLQREARHPADALQEAAEAQQELLEDGDHWKGRPPSSCS